MVTLIKISSSIKEAKGVQGLLEVYEDLAAQKMQAIRDEIGLFRDYYDVLSSISGEVGVDVASVVKKKAKEKVYVLISSNLGLYGDVFDKLGETFREKLKEEDVEAFVVGSIGEELIKRVLPNKKFTAVNPDEQSLADLWRRLSEYQEIHIYYLKYANLAKQEVSQVKFSGDLVPQSGEDFEIMEKQTSFLYEPSVAGISEVFANEVLTFLAEQTMKESDLSKYSARLMYLDGCIDRNSENVKTMMNQRMILLKRLQNKRQNARVINYLTRT